MNYVFLVTWTSNNVDLIHHRVFQSKDRAETFYANLQDLLRQEFQDSMELDGEVIWFDFRIADRVEFQRFDVN